MGRDKGRKTTCQVPFSIALYHALFPPHRWCNEMLLSRCMLFHIAPRNHLEADRGDNIPVAFLPCDKPRTGSREGTSQYSRRPKRVCLCPICPIRQPPYHDHVFHWHKELNRELESERITSSGEKKYLQVSHHEEDGVENSVRNDRDQDASC